MLYKHTLVLFSLLIASHALTRTKPKALTLEVGSIRRADPDMRDVRMQSLPGGGLNPKTRRVPSAATTAADFLRPAVTPPGDAAHEAMGRTPR